ncbi:MAG: efflux RND transporter periplasmic adaptor subunit [Acidobacteriota bacterium]
MHSSTSVGGQPRGRCPRHRLADTRAHAAHPFDTQRRVVVALLVTLWGVAWIACGPENAGPHDSGSPAERLESDDSERHDDDLVILGADALRGLEIETALAERRPLAPTLETTGQVAYDEDRVVHVGPRIDGRVVQAPVRLGDRVAAGQLLATLDSVALGTAEADWLAAVAREELTRRELEREVALFADEITSERQLLAARAETRVARAERRHAEQTLRLFGLDSAALERLASDGTPSLLRLVAPLGGTVVEKHATLGELAAASESLFTLADLDRVWVWIDVFEHQLAGVHVGDAVEVRVEAFPERVFTGDVSYLAAEVRPETRSVRARLDVRNPEGTLRPGMFASVRLVDPHGSSDTPSLVVPAEAVMRSETETIVFVPHEPSTADELGAERGFDARRVEIGRREGAWIEVLAGLEAGEPVVTTGAFVLKSERARELLGGGHSH